MRSLLCLVLPVVSTGFITGARLSRPWVGLYSEPIVSPFENPSVAVEQGGYLDLTWENVELVLDDLRPYLIQDGGNVAIKEIDGPVVRLELQVRMCVCLYVCMCEMSKEMLTCCRLLRYIAVHINIILKLML
jgi:NifU-like domain